MSRCALLFALLVFSPAAVDGAGPVPVILDTDIMSDVDDVGAVAVLHALANRGEAKILAMGVSVKNPWSPLCLDALNTYFGRPEIPLGVPKDPALNEPSKYAQAIAREFPHALKSAENAPDVVSLYRQTLAMQPDKSVVIVSIGTLTNLSNLLKSPPDQFSDLTGTDLVKRKVRAWVCMGGKFPVGREYNLFSDGPAAAYAVQHWPTRIVYSGFDIGDEIFTGANLRNAGPKSPVRRAYELYNGLHNRQSWDQTAVLYAVRGLDGGLSNFWDTQTRKCLDVREDGSDVWQDCPGSRQSTLVKKAAPAKIAKAIEAMMLETPAAK